jgi:CheY-like chemotaxis protein
VAKIETGKLEVAVAPCDLNGLVRDVVEMMRVRLGGRDLELLCLQSPNVLPFVLADARKLRQVLINLLGNAIKFTPQGTVTLRVDAVPVDDAGRLRLRIEVEDSGIGIPRQDQGRVFEPFAQAENATSSQGSGLGLTITRQFVELMGGTIGLKSTLGRGSHFTVELPMDVATGSDVDGAEPAGEHTLFLEPGQPECRVLIVDDNAENSMLLEEMLKRAGFQTRVVDDGARAVEIFEDWRPHFIWMDLRMPKLSGTEATRRIRALTGGREVKIAAITASAFVSERDEVLAAGMDDFVRKPFHEAEILACMGRQLGIRYRQIPVTADAPPTEAVLRPEAMAALPNPLRRELEDAVVALNPGRISAAIDQVQDVDRELAAVLRLLAKRLAFTAIYQAIKPSENVVGRE